MKTRSILFALALGLTSSRLHAQDESAFGLNDAAGSVQVQNTGLILVAGAFTAYNGMPVGGIIRLNPDGTLDGTYHATNAIPAGSELLVRGNNKLLYFGIDPALNEGTPQPIARLTVNGDQDSSFAAAGDLATTPVTVAAPESSGRTVIGTDGGSRGFQILRLNSDGTVDDTFAPARVFFTNSISSVAEQVLTLVAQTDDKVLIGGGFTQVNAAPQAGIARLNADGALDTSFAVALTPPDALPTVGGVDKIILLSNGQVMIGGTFDAVNGVAQRNFARLNPDGTLDASFVPDPAIVDANPTLLAVDADDKPIFQLQLVSVSGQPLVRLNADGSLDTSFNATVTGGRNPRNPAVLDLAFQTDGQLLIAGNFTGVNGDVRNNLARLNPDGSVDPSFNVGGALPTSQSTVSVSAPADATLEKGDAPGVFVITRTGGDMTADLTVNFTVSGSAVPGVNYQPLPGGAVIIPATRASAKLKVKPYDDGVHTGDLSVKITLQPGNYMLGGEVKAKVVIVDAE